MKKGFTLVEIILSISLVLIVGVSTTFFIFNNKSNKELVNVTKEILEAAYLYATIEKDENGNIYLNEVKSGKQGIKIPLNNLVNKGYINKKLKEEVIELSNKGTDYNYYIMLLNGEEDDYCNGEVFSLASWIDTDINKDIYLCNTSSVDVNVFDQIESFKVKVSLDKFAVSEEYYDSLVLDEEIKKKYFTYEENGLFLHYNEETNNVYYYYRGVVDNNYVKYGTIKDTNGNEYNLVWRIVWINDENKLKLILNDVIPLDIFYEDGKRVNIEEGSIIYNFRYKKSTSEGPFYSIIKDFSFLLEDASIDETKEWKYTTFKYDIDLNKKLKMNYREPSEDPYETIYYTSMENWFKQTSLLDEEIVIDQNSFCINNNYFISEFIDCSDGESGNDLDWGGTKKSVPVGFLTTGELKRAGFISSSSYITEETFDIKSSNNYLFDTVKNNIVSEGSYKWDFVRGLYHLTDKGLESKIHTNTCYSPVGYDIYYTYHHVYYDGDMLDYYQEGNSIYDGELTDYCEGFSKSSAGPFKLEKTDYYASTARPVIVVDTTNINLSGNGTESNPYTFVTK